MHSSALVHFHSGALHTQPGRALSHVMAIILMCCDCVGAEVLDHCIMTPKICRDVPWES